MELILTMVVIKICIITHTHLSRNPRVLKEALALSHAGYQVHILNSVYSSKLIKEDYRLLSDKSITISHVSNLSEKSFTTFADRAIKKLGTLFVRYFNVETRFALGYAPSRYLRMSKEVNADLYICHQELPIYIGTKLIEHGYRVAFDIEDWHSEDLPKKAQSSRPIRLLKKIEKLALDKGKYCTTTSKSLAKQLGTVYNVRVPEVIYNSFNLNEAKSNSKKIVGSPLKLVWFSLNIGPGRGLEEFLSISNKIDTAFEIHFIGEIHEHYKKILESIEMNNHKLIFHPMVDADKLCALLSTFDIGLALELKQPKNRQYTITNKFFQYIQCGLPLIATNTAGQKEIFEHFCPGLIIDFDKINLNELKNWLTNSKGIEKSLKQVEYTSKYYDWLTESSKLLKLVEYAAS